MGWEDRSWAPDPRALWCLKEGGPRVPVIIGCHHHPPRNPAMKGFPWHQIFSSHNSSDVFCLTERKQGKEKNMCTTEFSFSVVVFCKNAMATFLFNYLEFDFHASVKCTSGFNFLLWNCDLGSASHILGFCPPDKCLFWYKMEVSQGWCSSLTLSVGE